MVRVPRFPQCPRCGGRSFLSRLNVYRCPFCGQFCCDRCLRRSWFGGPSCPSCGVRVSMVQVGVTR